MKHQENIGRSIIFLIHRWNLFYVHFNPCLFRAIFTNPPTTGSLRSVCLVKLIEIYWWNFKICSHSIRLFAYFGPLWNVERIISPTAMETLCYCHKNLCSFRLRYHSAPIIGFQSIVWSILLSSLVHWRTCQIKLEVLIITDFNRNQGKAWSIRRILVDLLSF